ncbi:hypothetical protein MP228_010872 [Amoeboaphelidium protococcarum]|nr:hypothetical protein MP228_010872 [Amoeboaphelidium protococcarum]
MSRTKLFVGNLNRDAREEEMREFFGRLGEVRSVQVRNGYGFVEFADERDAEDAKSKFDGAEFLNQRINLEWSKSQRRDGGDRDGPPPSGGGGGFDRYGPPPPRGGDRYGYDAGPDRYGGPPPGGRFDRDSGPDRYGPPRGDFRGPPPPRDDYAFGPGRGGPVSGGGGSRDRYGPPGGGYGDDRRGGGDRGGYGAPPPFDDRYGGGRGRDDRGGYGAPPPYERRGYGGGDDRRGGGGGGDSYGGGMRGGDRAGASRYGKARSTSYRFIVKNFAPNSDWFQLKDFFRKAGFHPTYTVMYDRENGEGTAHMESQSDLDAAFEKLNGTEFEGRKIELVIDSNASNYGNSGRDANGDERMGDNGDDSRRGSVNGGAERGRSASPGRAPAQEEEAVKQESKFGW